MLEFIRELLGERGIDLTGALPLDACRVTRGYLLEREGIAPGGGGTVIVVALPYLAPTDTPRNISAYAVGENYHRFFETLFADILPVLRGRYPENKFAGYADTSPVDERDAAAKAGVGIIGRHGLLITRLYSSYIFLGEIITDAVLPCEAGNIEYCEDCGLCRAACPYALSGRCLSAINQKKGALTAEEAGEIAASGLVWGCDICQEACPHTAAAIERGSIYTRIPYFLNNLTSRLTADLVRGMSEEEFALRAYSWRGREVVLRNTLIVGEAKGD